MEKVMRLMAIDVLQELASRANISCDRFIRTTDPDHREAVEYVWVSPDRSDQRFIAHYI